MSKSIYNELNTAIEKNKSNIIDICDAVLELILSKPTEDQLSYFETFLRDFEIADLDVDDLNDVFSALNMESISSAREDADQLGNRIINNLVKKNVTEAEFYRELWRMLQDDILVDNKQSKVLLLARFWMDFRTPYFQLAEGCTMDDDEYRSVIGKIEPQLKKATYILHAGLPEKTQKSSLLMSVADEIKDPRERAAFWAVVLDRESIRQACVKMVRKQEKDDPED